MTALEEMNQDGLDANPSQGSPTNSLSSQRSKRSRTESSADLTEAIQDSSSVTSTSAKIPGLGGYALGVSVHKVTSTRLLSRFHKNSQESKDFAAILHPSLLPPAKETTTAGSGADKNAHNHVGAYRKKKPTHTAGAGECNWCGTRKTAQWRKGPTGPRGLCNWAKQIRFEAKLHHLSNFEAEARLVYTYKDSERFKRFAREHLDAVEPNR
ncbi:hypothetical protein HDU91_005629 [Kappamyces sp. JEL0680]|nr:hypothetical protein HDU91_005629 [Kappamyces sp. JEL0680]